MHRWLLLLAACSSSPSSSTTPPTVASQPDAAVDALPPDAPSATDGALASAEPHVFRFNAPPRVEMWTLRIAGERASIVVAAANETVYVGSFVDGKLDVATSTAKLSLVCKRDKLANVGEVNAKPSKKCAFAKTATLDVWQCKHPDFEAAMPFAAAPGVEFAVVVGCNAYRRL